MNDKIMVKRDIVIIGGGPAGLAAALAAKKEGAESILILERDKAKASENFLKTGKAFQMVGVFYRLY